MLQATGKTHSSEMGAALKKTDRLLLQQLQRGWTFQSISVLSANSCLGTKTLTKGKTLHIEHEKLDNLKNAEWLGPLGHHYDL